MELKYFMRPNAFHLNLTMAAGTSYSKMALLSLLSHQLTHLCNSVRFSALLLYHETSLDQNAPEK